MHNAATSSRAVHNNQLIDLSVLNGMQRGMCVRILPHGPGGSDHDIPNLNFA